MTVKELIKRLKKFDQGSLIGIEIEDELGFFVLHTEIFGVVTEGGDYILKGVQID